MAEKPEFVIGCDPGVTTGLALVKKEDSTLTVVAVEEVDSRKFGEWDSAAVCVGWILAHIKSHPVSTIVLEDFVLRQSEMSRSLLSPVRITMLIAAHFALSDSISSVEPNPRPGQPFPLISATPAYASKTKIEFLVQQPSQAKSVFTNDRLKTYGIYDPTIGMNHARDAVRHAALVLHA